MKNKYPIVLVHGIMLKDVKFFKAFGRIKKFLKKSGYTVYTANTDGFGTIEHNAAQLKSEIETIIAAENSEKVNVVAHSRGGLDAKYMIKNLNMEDKVASLTTLCTPHKGSQIATKLLNLPKPAKKFIAFWINTAYKMFGDKKPDSLAVCIQLQKVDNDEIAPSGLSDKVYCQSYSSRLLKGKDDFIMGIPLFFSKKYEKDLTDGLVSVESAKFGEYRGDCVEGSVSHSEIAGFMVKKKKKEKIYAFYLQLADELAQMGF